MNQQTVHTNDIQEKIFQEEETEKQSITKKKRTASSNINPFKQAPEKYLQGTLFPSNIFNLLPEAHECVI